jgi:hypothetical protein
MSSDKNIESIKSKILKLHALAESGNTHEAKNAQAMLERWLMQYGLTLDEILSEKDEVRWYKFKVRNKLERKLLMQCYFFVKNLSKCSYKQGTGIIAFELTSYEFAEITNYYEWHRVQLAKEYKALQQDFVEAYALKHGLTSSCDSGEPEELTEEQLKKLAKILTLMKTVEDTSYRKLLNQ